MTHSSAFASLTLPPYLAWLVSQRRVCGLLGLAESSYRYASRRDDGPFFCALSIIDVYTRECLALEGDTSFGGQRVTRVLEEILPGREKHMLQEESEGRKQKGPSRRSGRA